MYFSTNNTVVLVIEIFISVKNSFKKSNGSFSKK